MPRLGRTLSPGWYSTVAVTIADKLKMISGRRKSAIDSVVPRSREDILETIDRAIIPHLLDNREEDRLLRDVHISPSWPPNRAAIGPDTVTTFARTLVDSDADGASAVVERLLDEGIGDEALCTDLLTPAARLLGDWWVKDLCGFAEVTLGLLLLHDILRKLSENWEAEHPSGGSAGEALFIVPPGEQHILGLSMVADFFKKASWDVRLEFPQTIADVAATATQGRATIVGLTCSSEAAFPGLKIAISSVRNHLTADGAHIMVGGHIFHSRPALVGESGADSAACDTREALEMAARVSGTSLSTAMGHSTGNT